MVRTIFWYAAGMVLLLDQAVKASIEATKPDAFLIRYVQNTGAGFGILQGQTFWLALISLAVAVAVLLNYRKIPDNKWPQLLWGMFLGGVIGNLIDRILRGYVIDFIDVGFWPAFNVADAALTISVMGLIVYYWKN